jgi:hypothetical protein
VVDNLEGRDEKIDLLQSLKPKPSDLQALIEAKKQFIDRHTEPKLLIEVLYNFLSKHTDKSKKAAFDEIIKQWKQVDTFQIATYPSKSAIIMPLFLDKNNQSTKDWKYICVVYDNKIELRQALYIDGLQLTGEVYKEFGEVKKENVPHSRHSSEITNVTNNIQGQTLPLNEFKKIFPETIPKRTDIKNLRTRKLRMGVKPNLPEAVIHKNRSVFDDFEEYSKLLPQKKETATKNTFKKIVDKNR